MNLTYQNWILLFFLSFVWGSSFILMKLGMFTSTGAAIFSDTQVAALRMLLASLTLLPFAIRKFHLLKSLRNLRLLSIVGFAGNFLPAFLFTYAETELPSGYAGMLNSFTPIFALIIGWGIFKSKLTNYQLIGVFIGTTGIVLLTLSGSAPKGGASWLHIGAIVLATLCYAISLNTIKYTLNHIKSIEITSLSFAITLPISIAITFVTDIPQTLLETPNAFQGFSFIAILSVIGTALAVVLFTKLISNSSILFASSVTYLIPLVALLIGLVFDEPINIYQITSMILVLCGIFMANVLTNRKSSQRIKK